MSDESGERLPIHELLPIMVGEALDTFVATSAPDTDEEVAAFFLKYDLSRYLEQARRLDIPEEHRKATAERIKATLPDKIAEVPLINQRLIKLIADAVSQSGD